MKTKFANELCSMYDALRLLEKTKAALFAGAEPLLAGRVGGIMREVEMAIETWEVVECRANIQAQLTKK